MSIDSHVSLLAEVREMTLLGGNKDPSHKFLRSSDFYLFEILL